MDLGAFLAGDGNDILFGQNRFAGFVDAPRTKPVIAAVEGAALAGGLEIALACDMIVASETAIFGLPEVGVGIFPVAGGAFRLARRIPPAKALELCFTADRLTASDAAKLGLINRLVPARDALHEARALAARILKNAPLATQAVLKVHHATEQLRERELWSLCEELWPEIAASADAVEGPLAFKEKRKPL